MGMKNQEPGQSQMHAHKKVEWDSQKHKQKTEEKTTHHTQKTHTKNREPEKLTFWLIPQINGIRL